MKKQALILLMLLSVAAQAQKAEKCGLPRFRNQLIAKNPNNAVLMQQHKTEWEQKVKTYAQSLAQSQAKGTAANPVIPVVFHVVLNASQMSSMGGTAGVQNRIKKQMDVLNACFNAKNSDSAQIFSGFKPLFGNAHMSFGLAHTKPDGTGTDGIDIKVTTLTGFDESGGTGSGGGYSDAKYAASGGLDAWDVTKYMNIWVLNDKGMTGIMGETTPPEFLVLNVPAVELGITLFYPVVGDGTGGGSYIPGVDKGHTLVHETGHYFNLMHIWGDDGGSCPGSPGGDDDGIADTPPQADMSMGLPNAPDFDNCTTGGNGIMFMNYMDYTEDGGTHMFSKDQATAMQQAIQQPEYLYSLTQHPEVLQWPAGVQPLQQEISFSISPNPANGIVQILFNSKVGILHSVTVTDITGREVLRTTATETGHLSLDLSTKAKGMYMVHCSFDKGTISQKLVLQ